MNKLMTNEQTQILSENTIDKLNLVNNYVQFGRRKCLVKGKINCRGSNLYALECEIALTGYDGLCPQCRDVHMHSSTFFRDSLKTSPFVSLMSKRTFDESKSPPSPLSPGQQKRVRFLVDNNNDLSIDEHQSSILFRQGNIGGRTGNISGFDEMENSRRITSNLLFSNTSSPYDFGLMTQTGGSIDQPIDNVNVSNDNFTFIQTTQRTNLANESGNDGTWLTVFGYRTNAEAQILIDEFSRFGIIEKYVIVDTSNIFHVKFATHLQAQRALRKHGHVFGQIMVGVRYCTDKDIIGLKPQSNVNVYLENPFLIRHRHHLGILPSAPLTVQN
ncbi:unnamed protein product [Rotaria sordida]|uniref:Nucleoporin NUP35 n=2 Tax=Rotaria sordida TaxID=392033 RepID=A0A814QRT0_9BILA|nr:unnamed protein product [Rotaria sordida]CAF1123432.1 unnamed protein product [Rotaria sordida]